MSDIEYKSLLTGTTLTNTTNHAANGLLAERLDKEAVKCRFYAEYMKSMDDRVNALEMAETLRESARRLRIKPKEVFNHEAFE